MTLSTTAGDSTTLPAAQSAAGPLSRYRTQANWRSLTAGFVIGLAGLPTVVAAQQQDSIPFDNVMDAEDRLAQQLNNPLANLITVPIQNNFDYCAGRNGDGRSYTLVVQPVTPFELNEDWNLISRTVIPYASVSNVFPNTESGLGDIIPSLWLSPSKPTSGGLIWGLGTSILLPTATNDLLGNDQWGGRPSAVPVVTRGPWTALVLGSYL